ncbi:MAG: ubiquinol-cytochrome c reductase iron-sulfur subunit [Candidatus Binatia bacterium]
MARIFAALSRRSLLRLALAVPFVESLGLLLERFLGLNAYAAEAAPRLKVAKVSRLDRPWSTAPFEYSIKVEGKDIKGDRIGEEHLPGLVVRLPDDLAQQRAGGTKGKFEVVNLYCTHQRCKTAFIRDAAEIQGMTGQKIVQPVFYCPCHRSLFDATKEGAPMEGSEAKLPLWKFEFEVKGDDIIVTGIDPKTAAWNPGRAGGLTSEYPVRPGERGL